jgi:hypothetical protein
MTNPSSDSAFVERLERVGPALVALADEMQTTKRHEGTDLTGTIRVLLAGDGLPELIDVADYWQRGVGVEGFAAAVTEACRAATLSADHDLDRLAEQTGWMGRVLAVLAYLNGTGTEPPEVSALTPDAAVTQPPRGPGVSRPLARILGDLMDIEYAEGSMLTSETRQDTGQAAQGRLTLTAVGNTVACAADAEWVGRREPEELREALAKALSGMRETRTRAAAAQAARSARRAELVAELASLRW